MADREEADKNTKDEAEKDGGRNGIEVEDHEKE